MSKNFENLVRYAFTEFHKSQLNSDVERVLDKVTDSLIDIAHENGWVEELTLILDEFKS
jgi:hypothetical protein